jgi:ribulose-5-phosphate 4-epimerase/fuculose-1-phosphate aldolase
MSISIVDNNASASVENDAHYEDRVNLAAVFRMTARLGMNEGIANHFSYAVSNDGSQFLINPNGRHFSNIRASELLLLDAHDDSTMDQPNAPDPTAWAIHSALGDEAERLSSMLGDNKVLLMGNHGCLTVGESIAGAFDEMFYFERSCSNYINALMTGKPLRVATPEVAEKTARQWEAFSKAADIHLSEVKEILDREEPDYKL